MGKYELTQNAYPVLVLRALENGLRNYDEIRKHIAREYREYISTKTIYRHIKLIKSLGFEISDNPPCVTWPNDQKYIVEVDEKFGHAAYPLMILVVLQSECTYYEEIIERINLIYKTKIERKAVGRNMRLLGKIGYRIFDPYFYFNYQLGGCE